MWLKGLFRDPDQVLGKLQRILRYAFFVPPYLAWFHLHGTPQGPWPCKARYGWTVMKDVVVPRTWHGFTYMGADSDHGHARQGYEWTGMCVHPRCIGSTYMVSHPEPWPCTRTGKVDVCHGKRPMKIPNGRNWCVVLREPLRVRRYTARSRRRFTRSATLRLWRQMCCSRLTILSSATPALPARCASPRTKRYHPRCFCVSAMDAPHASPRSAAATIRVVAAFGPSTFRALARHSSACRVASGCARRVQTWPPLLLRRRQ